MSRERQAPSSTPHLLVDAKRAREKFVEISDAFSSHLGSVIVALSYKTSYLPALFRELHSLGAAAEVVSGVEYELARRLGVPAERIVFNGPGKSRADLARSFDEGAIVNLDSLGEVDRAVELIGGRDTRGVGLRIALPLFEGSLRQTRSRFGLSPEGGELEEGITRLHRNKVPIRGIHAHFSSRARTLDYYRRLAEEVVAAVRQVPRSDLEYLDLGGGFGFAPAELPQFSFPAFEDYASTMLGALSDGLGELGQMRFIVEPGMALFGDLVSAYCGVLDLKRRGDRDLCIVDMSAQLIKPTGHDVNLPTRAFDQALVPKSGPPRRYDLVGYTCLEGDRIARDLELPALEVGDILKISNVGAYTFVFKPAFIRGMPEIYLRDDAGTRRIRSADRFEDLFANHEI